jgi:hypothetical protein
MVQILPHPIPYREKSIQNFQHFMKSRFTKRGKLVATFILTLLVLVCRAQELTMYIAPAAFDSIALTKAKAGYRLADLASFEYSNKEYYTAIWNKTADPEVLPRLSMDEKTFERTVKEMKEKGYRPGRSSVAIINGTVKYSVVFLKTAAEWIVKNNLSKSDFNKELEKNEKRGYGVVDICSYKTNEEKFLTVWEKGNKSNVETTLSSKSFESEITSQSYKNYVPVRITGFHSGFNEYSGIFMENKKPCYTILGVKSDWLKAEAKHASLNGATLKFVNAITRKDDVYFDAVFEGKSSNSLKEVLQEIKADAWRSRMGSGSIEPIKVAMDTLANERCCYYLPELWLRKWEVYSTLIQSKEMNIKYPGAASDAAYAIINYRLISNDMETLKKEGPLSFFDVYNLLLKSTHSLLEKKEYATAFTHAKGMVELSKVMIENKWIDDKFDTAAHYLAGHSGQLASDEECIDFYSEIADREIANDKYASIYGLLAGYYSLIDDEENYKKYLALARKIFPARNKEWNEVQAEHNAKTSKEGSK